MKTSLTDVSQTEKYLRHELSAEDSLVFQAQLLISHELRKDTFFHKIVHSMVGMYHRKKLKAEIEFVHQKLFNDPARANFRQEIMRLFNP
jgi:hypothetical protein